MRQSFQNVIKIDVKQSELVVLAGSVFLCQ